MKTLPRLLCLSVLASVFCVSCENTSPEQTGTRSDGQSQTLSGTNTDSSTGTFTEYSLDGKWTNLDGAGPGLLVIDSEAELAGHVDGTYPPVDFSKKTVLLAYGLELSQNHPDYVNFRQVSGQAYEMAVNLRISLAQALLDWRVAIVVDKLDADSTVELKITRE